ncbi:MAG: hypothetical protein CVU91_03810 [Firmicutes bacterium HGW-Firmicutes-16]|nr:MAG: hypothetical protein CVU91_03810 [Firmicutes bacterium HGW-Firmicutes-16]
MKGLLYKDLIMLTKQTKLYLLFIVIMSCIPNLSMLSFAVIYSTMMPMTALAFDERSKWDKLAAMMPYSATEMVVSKYLIGYIMVLSSVIIAIAARALGGIFGGAELTAEFFPQLLLIACIGLALGAFSLPLLIGLGVEKGRLFLIFILVMFSIVCLSGMEKVLSVFPSNAQLGILLAGAVLATLLLNLGSIALAAQLYKRKVD